MALINVHEIATGHGYKSIELHHGDLAVLPFPIDLIVFSAFKGAYAPSKSSVIAALKLHHGLDMDEVYESATINMTDALGVWLSSSIPGVRFQRVACVEIKDFFSETFDLNSAVQNLFTLLAIANMQGIRVESVAMPLLGAGYQRVSPQELFPSLIKLSLSALENFAFLKKIAFVEIDKSKIEGLDVAMNAYLARTQADVQKFPDDPLTIAIAEDLHSSLLRLQADFPLDRSPGFIGELCLKLRPDCLRSGTTRFFEVGILARRFCEAMVKDLLEAKTLEDLYTGINSLSERQIAQWIVGYLHVLRTLGNHAAHENAIKNKLPSEVEVKDLLTLMFCLNRLADFWLWYRLRRSTTSQKTDIAPINDFSKRPSDGAR